MDLSKANPMPSLTGATAQHSLTRRPKRRYPSSNDSDSDSSGAEGRSTKQVKLTSMLSSPSMRRQIEADHNKAKVKLSTTKYSPSRRSNVTESQDHNKNNPMPSPPSDQRLPELMKLSPKGSFLSVFGGAAGDDVSFDTFSASSWQGRPSYIRKSGNFARNLASILDPADGTPSPLYAPSRHENNPLPPGKAPTADGFKAGGLFGASKKENNKKTSSDREPGVKFALAEMQSDGESADDSEIDKEKTKAEVEDELKALRGILGGYHAGISRGGGDQVHSDDDSTDWYESDDEAEHIPRHVPTKAEQAKQIEKLRAQMTAYNSHSNRAVGGDVRVPADTSTEEQE